jgi:hypothetical protein
MAFNAKDNWEFPAAVVVAAEVAVEIGPNHVAPAKANPGAILQAAVFQREIRALGALLQPPGVAAAPPPQPPASHSSRKPASTKAWAS